jgi:hypothetical protein
MPKIKRQNTIRFLEKRTPYRVETINDLIRLGSNGNVYKNIDMNMLRRILPHLRELNSLVGMDSLKESVFFQIIYYLQGFNKNQNEEYLHTIIMGSPGCGKCLAINTPVLMYDGTIKMVQNVVVNDVLMGDDSCPRNVLNTCKGYEKLYVVNQAYGESYRVNGEHILSLKLSQGWRVITENEHTFKVRWCDARGKHTKTISRKKVFNPNINIGDIIEISVKDYLSRDQEWRSCFKGFKVSVEFEHITINLDPYFVGFWIGDCNNENIKLKTNKDINIYFLHYIRNMRSYVRYNINDLLYNKDINENREFQLFTQLRNYNLINNKCIPNCYKANSKEIRISLLMGILDSTIHVHTSEPNTIEIAIRWKELAEDIVFMCRSLGFISEMKIMTVEALRKNCIKHENYYTVRITRNFEDIPLKQMFRKISEENFSSIEYNIDVREDGEGEYYGFELDKNGRFLLGDFTVTHNTTVARILGKIYTSLGILSSDGEFRIAYRDDFIGEYLGHTAIKTRNLLQKCIGGVLFIDEVYSLAPRDKSRDSFSKEALDTLTAFLSEHKNDFCCIAAGYEKDIYDCFFNMNSGLARRFPWIHRVDDYSPENLTEIFIGMVKTMNWDICIEKSDIVRLIKENKKMFSNHGGSVEVYLSKCKMAHARRVFGLDDDHKFVLTEEDLRDGMDMTCKMMKTEDNYLPPPPMMYT